MHVVLSQHAIDYVKWDHNRDLLEAGSAARGGAPAVHAQTLAFYDLLDRLRAAHPDVAWESCASGGGRIDLGVLERVQRVWISDMTDAVARQQIQRWTTQLVAPEYAGAHVSAPRSHTTYRTLSLDFRAATALFGAFGIEWDLTEASEADLERAGVVGGAVQAVPAAAARRPRGASGVQRPDGAAARGGRRGPLGGAGRARADGRVRAQPWRPGAGAGAGSRARATTWPGRVRSPRPRPACPCGPSPGGRRRAGR